MMRWWATGRVVYWCVQTSLTDDERRTDPQREERIHQYSQSVSMFLTATFYGPVNDVFCAQVTLSQRARPWLSPAAAVYQRQLSVPSFQGHLMSTSEVLGVNGHTTRCTSPALLRLVSGWGLQEMEIIAAPWAYEAWEELYYLLWTNLEASLYIIFYNFITVVSTCVMCLGVPLGPVGQY